MMEDDTRYFGFEIIRTLMETFRYEAPIDKILEESVAEFLEHSARDHEKFARVTPTYRSVWVDGYATAQLRIQEIISKRTVAWLKETLEKNGAEKNASDD